MVKKAANVSIPAPGGRGITEENRFSANDPSWLKQGENLFINQNGLLQVRDGFTELADIDDILPTHTSPTLKSLYSFHMVNEAPDTFGGFIEGNNLTVTFFQTTSTLVGSPVSAIAAVFRGSGADGNGGLISLLSTGDEETFWKFSEAYSGTDEKRYVVGFHDDRDPLFWDPADISYSGGVAQTPGNASSFADGHDDWAATTSYSVGDTVRDTGTGGNTDTSFYFYASTGGTSDGSEPTWDFTDGEETSDGTVTWRAVAFPRGGCCHWAFGRLWAMDDSHTVLYFSGITEPFSFFGVNGGTLDLKKTEGFLAGVDRVIAITSYGNNLIILGRNNTLIYNDNPTNFALQEGIPNVGCIARDTVVNVENDVIWLDEGGLRSLRRNSVAPDRRLELYSPSRHNRELLLSDLKTLFDKDAPQFLPQATYDRRKGLYILSLEDRVWCFDTKFPNEDGTLRTTTWEIQDGSNNITPGITYDEVHDVITVAMGRDIIAYQEGNSDDGTTFTATWDSVWWNMGAEGEKILKSLHYHVEGGEDETFTSRWSQDFKSSTSTGDNKTLTSSVDHLRQPTTGIGEQWSFGASVTSSSNASTFYTVQMTVVKGAMENL